MIVSADSIVIIDEVNCFPVVDKKLFTSWRSAAVRSLRVGSPGSIGLSLVCTITLLVKIQELSKQRSSSATVPPGP